MADQARPELAQDLPAGVRRTYTALAEHGHVARSTLHHRARGRRSKAEQNESQQYLTPAEEKAIVKFVLQLAGLGRPVRIKYIPSLAFSVAQHRDPCLRPPKPPGKNWARSFERRHPELKAKRVRALDWNRLPTFTRDKILEWFEIMGKVLQDPSIRAENVYNMDETGVMLNMLDSVKVLVGKGDVRDYRGARVKRTTITAIECINADGSYLDPMIIWPASTHRVDWTTYHTPGWHYACSESGYTDSKISLEWLQRVFDPQTKVRAGEQPRMLICDGFGTHETVEMLEFCFRHNIILCRMPSHTSHKLQPCDVAVFAPLKAAYRDQVERLEGGGVSTIGKQHFTALYSPARCQAFTRRNILAGWAKSGLYPFNPQRVLREMPESSRGSDPVVSQDLVSSSFPEGEVRPTESLQSPTTPTSPRDVASLQQLINESSRKLDETSRE